ncbi:MAG: type IV pilus modification protein PilV [Nevskiaceae bacterium]|nr:MAG: type IV pilus modification protein PilV [Nevskiaceae bacterium]
MKYKSSKGFSLIEILIALVLLSLGLLGIEALVLRTVKGNDSAYMRSQNVQLAYSILDMMRANRAQAMAQGYDTAFTATCPPLPTAPAVLCDAAACTPAQLATWDLYQWQLRLCAALPSGQGKIATVTANGSTTATITIQWDDSRAQQGYSSATAAPNIVSFVLGTAL